MKLRSILKYWPLALGAMAIGCGKVHNLVDIAAPHHETAMSCKCPSIASIAHDLDHLQWKIDKYGSIMVKSPDVWGEARLTRYRYDFDTEMEKDQSKFAIRLSGARSFSEQQLLKKSFSADLNLDELGAMKASLSKGGGGGSGGTGGSGGEAIADLILGKSKRPVVTQTPVTTNVVVSSTDSSKSSGGGGGGGGGDGIDRTDVKKLIERAVNTDEATAISVEPVVFLDQKKRYLDHLAQLRRINEGDDNSDSPGYALYLIRVPVSILPGNHTKKGYGAEVTMSLDPIISQELLPMTFRSLVINDVTDQLTSYLSGYLNGLTDKDKCAIKESMRSKTDTNFSNKVAARNFAKTAVKNRKIGASSSRVAEYAFPTAHLLEIYSDNFLDIIENSALEISTDKSLTHYHELRPYVRELVVDAYRTLARERSTWEVCKEELVTAIRKLDMDNLNEFRKQFLTQMYGGKAEDKQQLKAAFAWAVVVESALLNAQLVRDVKETAINRGKEVPAYGWLDYYHPDASPEAREAFRKYVEIRWPVQVFALDPENDQQNIADSFSSRREMQSAIALSVASGYLSAERAVSSLRRIEADYETIELNRVGLAFSSGNKTFGWRFHPRFQTPESMLDSSWLSSIGCSLNSFDLFGLRKDVELCERRIEPGPRECVAMVVMPSFVPNCKLNVSTSWFKLTHPSIKEFTTSEAVHLSKLVRSIDKCSPGASDLDYYRPGELERLRSKLDQLSTRLPLQDMTFQVPYENTLGGFEFFNSGITDLAPQLKGWYGLEKGPGPSDTSLFLMGDNFSINSTRIIIGGKKASFRLLSRQVIQVFVPDDAKAMKDKDGKQSVSINVATPYGVSNTLEIPIDADLNPSSENHLPTLATKQLDLGFVYDGVAIRKANIVNAIVVRPTVRFVNISRVAPKADIKFQLNGREITLEDMEFSDGQFINLTESLADTIYRRFSSQFGPENINPPKNLILKDWKLNWKNGELPVGTTSVKGELEIQWIKVEEPKKP